MKPFLIILSLLWLSACSKPSTAVIYYQLASPSQVKADLTVTGDVYLAPIRVAPYLNGSGLVVQQSEVAFAVSRQHLWVDALQQQLQRQLTDYRLRRFPAQQLALHPTTAATSLQIEIDHFYADETGVAQLSGHYRYTLAETVITRAFLYQVPLTAEGYPAMVAALSQAWWQLLADLDSPDKAG